MCQVAFDALDRRSFNDLKELLLGADAEEISRRSKDAKRDGITAANVFDDTAVTIASVGTSDATTADLAQVVIDPAKVPVSDISLIC